MAEAESQAVVAMRSRSVTASDRSKLCAYIAALYPLKGIPAPEDTVRCTSLLFLLATTHIFSLRVLVLPRPEFMLLFARVCYTSARESVFCCVWMFSSSHS